MSRVFFDTNLFIYLLEGDVVRGGEVRSLIQRMKLRGDQLMTSTMTVGEVLVKPKKIQNWDLAKLYETQLLGGELLILPFDITAAFHFADICATTSTKSQDAIQLACAAAASCDLFVTNDLKLCRLIVPGIQFIVTLDRVPF